MIVAAVTATAFVLTNESTEPPLSQGSEPITFEEFLSGAFRAKYFNGSWSSDTEIQWKDALGNLVAWNVETEETTVIVSSDLLDDFQGSSSFKGYAPNSDSLLLFTSHKESVWRHSFLAVYSVFDSAADKTYALVPPGMPEDTKLQYAEWLPHPTANKLVYVYNNNIYVREVPSDLANDRVVTTDGENNEIYNGVPDWVYEEEVLSTNKAMYYSDGGTNLMYARFDDTEVGDFNWQNYGNPNDPKSYQYPKDIYVKYPKTGTTNPTLQLKVANLNDMQSKNVTPPTEVTDFGEFLYSAAGWITEERLSVIWMNRVQDKSVISECQDNGSSWICTSLYEIEEVDGWLDLFQPPVYKKTGEAMLQIQSSNNYKHIAKFTLSTSVTDFLTSGSFVVTSILGWDEVNGIIYFMGTESGKPGSRHLYSVSSTGADMNCMTCLLPMPSTNAPCLYNSISMSKEFTYYVQNCYGPSIPEVVVRQVSDNSLLHNLEDNADLIAKLQPKAVPGRMFIEVDVEGGYKAQVRALMPPNFDDSGATKYPMVVDVYGGPESQDVNYRYSVGWGDYLSTNHDIIYVSIDGRGTGFQSNDMMFEVYKRLGSVEMDDQIAVAQTLINNYPFIDATRTGIWGWSYGGYATAMTLIRDTENVFACGISVAPPTTWLFYDTVYTERYMRLPTPEDNEVGYAQGSVLDKVEALRGKKYLLNHGVADDNVHYQNSMMFVEALERADIQFEQRSFPDENHGIGGLSRFLYHGFDDFWGRCFDYEVNIPPPSKARGGLGEVLSDSLASKDFKTFLDGLDKKEEEKIMNTQG